MFIPKKRIPKLAVGMLTLTGCGEADSLSDAVQAFCMKLGTCYAPLYPNLYAQECIDYVNDYISFVGEYINIDGGCEAAVISYLNCGAALSCQELMEYSNSCDDDFDAIFEICEPIVQ